LLCFSANSLIAGRGDAQPTHHLLTINVVGNGFTGAIGVVPLALVCNPTDSNGGQCVYSVPDGTAVRLNGNAPTIPAVFSGGTGAATGCVTSTCRFDMTGDATITATLDQSAPAVSMSITLAGTGLGEVFMDNTRCQNYDHDLSHLPTQYSGCVSMYAPGSEVDLLAWPPLAARFNEFSAGTGTAAVCLTDPRCTFILNADESVTARFSALTSLVVTPPNDTISVGQSRQYTATGHYSDGSTNGIFGGTGTWKTRTSMLEPRFHFAAAAAGGRVFALGGINGRDENSSMLASVEAFDPATNSWTPQQGMSEPRAGLAAAADDRYLYVVGGNIGGACPIANLDRYDTQLDAWSPLDPMPAGPRRNLSAVVVGHTLYAIGGELNQCFASSGTPLAIMEAYDLVTGQWSARPPMPTARTGFGVAVVDGIIYAIGGGDMTGNLATVEAYDPATGAWTTKAPMPSGRSLLAVAAIDKMIYAIGGNHGGGFSDGVSAYDPSTNAWAHKVQVPSLIDTLGPNSEFANIPGRRAQHSAATVNGIIYVMGGLVNDSGTPPPPPVNHTLSFVDGLVWNSSNTAVATIVNQNESGFAFGRATALQDGTTNITAKVGTLSCSISPGQCATLTVNSVVPNTVPTVTLFGNAAVTINLGQNVSVTGSPSGSFRDPDLSQSWIAKVNYGDNTGEQPLGIVPGTPPNGPNGTFSLNHIYSQSGVFTVTVTVTDSVGGVGTATKTVTVNAPQISLGLPGSASTNVNSNNSFACGSFFQSNVGSATFAATVDYGDGSGVQPLPLTIPGVSCGGNSTGTFSFSHMYATAGLFTASVTVTNNTTGVSKTGGFPVQVNGNEDPDPGCAVVTTNIVASNVPFTSIQMSLFQRNPDEFLFTDNLPLGTTEIGEAPEGQYRAVFTVPAGYVISPPQIEFDAICGTPVLLTAHITAVDTTAPVITSVTPSVSSLWPANRKMVAVAIAVVASDAVDPTPACSITSVSSNEAVGETTPDWEFSPGSLQTALRAERDVNRIYTIIVSCSDDAGNSATATTMVVVPHDRRQ
jgi:hypothetical protein